MPCELILRWDECQLNVECINGVFNDFFGALLRLRWSV